MVIDFVKGRFAYIGISLAVILVGICFMIFNSAKGNGAFNYDVQFVGGTSVEAVIGTDFNNDDIKKIVTDTCGDKNPQIQKVDDGKTVAVKTAKLDDEKKAALKSALAEKYNISDENLNSMKIEDVSATLSKEMQKNAVISLLLACIAMLIYVSIRFKEIVTGASCILALINDTMVVLGSYAILRIPMDSAFIAVILTVVGYSINASVVVFDRIRENKKTLGRKNYTELVNQSVSQTLRRSIFTSLTTFFAVACLYVFGVQSVKEFALPISIGIVAGAYSSVFMSANIWYILSNISNKKKA